MEEAIKKKVSVEEYFELEKNSEIRHEYYQGEMFDMAGTTDTHNAIVYDCVFALKYILKGTDCKVYGESVKLEVQKDEYYTYSDVMVTCDKKDTKDNYTKRSPIIIIEVLSKSTEDHVKFVKYRSIKSLQYYIMVSQKETLVECYTRGKGQMWTLNTYSLLNDTIELNKLSVKLALKDIYEGI